MISTQRQKEIIDYQERIGKNICSIRQIMNNHHSPGDFRKQKLIDQAKDRSSKIDKKDREKADSQRKRHQEADGQRDKKFIIQNAEFRIHFTFHLI